MRRPRFPRYVGILAVVAVSAACASDGDSKTGPASDSPPPTSAAPTLDPSETAGDSGDIEIVDTGFTIDDTNSGSADVLTAIEVENTSKTDMLNEANVELTWIDKAGGEVVEKHSGTELLSIAPGETSVVGGLQSTTLIPVDLKARITGPTWYAMTELEELDADPRIDQGDTRLTVSGDRVKAEFSFSTDYDYEFPLNLRAYLVMYDEDGELLGASEATDGITLSPHETGEHGVALEFPHADWIPEASTSAGKVVATWGFAMVPGNR